MPNSGTHNITADTISTRCGAPLWYHFLIEFDQNCHIFEGNFGSASYRRSWDRPNQVFYDHVLVGDFANPLQNHWAYDP